MSKVETKSLAELEADLFLAERAFKRVPSEENENALANIKKAYDALQGGNEVVADTKPVIKNTPVVPKAAAPKSAAKASQKPVTPTNTDDSKKN